MSETRITHYTTPSMLNSKTITNTAFNRHGASTRHFSGTDAEIYFEDYFIDEITQFAFQVQQNTLPLFGYNSYVFDDVAVGARSISGNFAINFTKSGYLYEVLNTLKQLTIKNAPQTRSILEDGTLDQHDELLINREDLSEDKTIEHIRKPLWKHSFNIVLSYGDQKKMDSPSGTMYVLTGVQLSGSGQSFNSSGEPIMEVYSFIAQDLLMLPTLLNPDGE